MSRNLWTLGVLLVGLGIAALIVGWDALLWLPVQALDALWWVPATVAGAFHAAPVTFAVIGLGVVLLVVARVLRQRGHGRP